MRPIQWTAATEIPEQAPFVYVSASTMVVPEPLNWPNPKIPEGRGFIANISSKPENEGETDTAATSSASSTTQIHDTSRLAVNENMLEFVAENDPEKLLLLINSGNLDTPDLALAAEIAGTISVQNLVVPVLLDLLSHESAVVREGAIYGLAPSIRWSSQARVALSRHCIPGDEPSLGVRQAAKEALELLDE